MWQSVDDDGERKRETGTATGAGAVEAARELPANSQSGVSHGMLQSRRDER